jgi:hypothetical protein
MNPEIAAKIGGDEWVVYICQTHMIPTRGLEGKEQEEREKVRAAGQGLKARLNQRHRPSALGRLCLGP